MVLSAFSFKTNINSTLTTITSMRNAILEFAIILLTFPSLILFSCREEIPKVPLFQPNEPVCFDQPINPDWLIKTVRDSFEVSYPTEAFGCTTCRVLQVLLSSDINMIGDKLQMELGYCRGTPDGLFEYCLNGLLYNKRDFISRNLPDSTISQKFSGQRRVLKNIILICKEDETIGAVYYTRYKSWNKINYFVGKLYYTHLSDPDNFYFMGRMNGDIEGFEVSLKVINSLNPIY